MLSENSSLMTRSSLIRRAGDREAEAWCEIVDLYGPLIAHWCRRCGLESHSAADCVQDVFTSVAVSITAFEPVRSKGSFRAWLWTITRRKVLDQRRKLSRHPHPAGGSTAAAALQQVVDIATVPDEEPTGDHQLQSLIHRALQQVRHEYEASTWQAFWRSVVDGVPTDVVAKELSVSPAAVRQARSRILRKLRQQLGDM
jgi:RNA polymerase sigma-70 factor (ECF subfamily)